MYKEKTIGAISGWAILPLLILIIAGTVWLFIHAIATETIWQLIVSIVGILVSILLATGFFVVNPNEAAALLLFGNYRGSVKQNGFCWANPFLTKMKLSLRARNLNGEKLKVNDLSGNPIEIAAVVVWQVEDTAEALFEVDDYEEYVTTQSEAAVRNLASAYPYDGDEGHLSLRGSTEELNDHLQKELQERLQRAGVNVNEARLSHLAYSPEIAGAMLQRQQASAVVAARQKIVEGAVGMVELALEELNKKSVITLDEERLAAMVSNLMVVLCSEHSAQPVVNTGTLYQ